MTQPYDPFDRPLKYDSLTKMYLETRLDGHQVGEVVKILTGPRAGQTGIITHLVGRVTLSDEQFTVGYGVRFQDKFAEIAWNNAETITPANKNLPRA